MKVARLWFADGVLLDPAHDLIVPDPPPHAYRVSIAPAPDFANMLCESPAAFYEPLIAEFELTDWSRSGEVAHYRLRGGPPTGYRWLVVNGHIRSERTSSRSPSPC